MRSTGMQHAEAPFVLAVDVGSSSVRALIYDRHGSQVEDSETQVAYTQSVTSDGGSESDPDRILALLGDCIDGVTAFAGEHDVPIAAVATTSFWHGLMGLDADGAPATPIYMWSDKRSGADALALAEDVDALSVHQQTGCRLHSSYWPAKLRWLRRERPDQADKVATWVSITDYLAKALSGELRTSVSMASGTGLLNTATLDWDERLLALLGIEPEHLPPISDRTEPYDGLVDDYATRWPGLDGIPWYPAIGDGAAANVGAGCVGRSRVAMTVGTSAAMRIVVPDEPAREQNPLLPPRIWSYRLDRAWRVLGGALSNGGNVTGWLADHLGDGDFDELTEAAGKVEPDGHGLTMLPFLAGERSPSWNDRATGTISGLRLATTGGDIFRAALEATAYRMAAIYDDVRTLATPDHEIHANGAAVLKSPLWLQIIADTLGHNVAALDADAEASARGAAVCALLELRAIQALDAMPGSVSRRHEPDMAVHQRYLRARARQARLEDAANMFLR